MTERPYLDHVYSGPARPVKWGGAWVGPDELIGGAFHTEDFQDGAGILLTNGEERTERMGWVVYGKYKREVRSA